MNTRKDYVNEIVARISKLDVGSFNKLYDATIAAKDAFNEKETRRIVDCTNRYAGSVISSLMSVPYSAGKAIKKAARENAHAEILLGLEDLKLISQIILSLLESIGSEGPNSFQFIFIEFIGGRNRIINNNDDPFHALRNEMEKTINKSAFAKAIIKDVIAGVKNLLAAQLEEKVTKKIQ